MRTLQYARVTLRTYFILVCIKNNLYINNGHADCCVSTETMEYLRIHCFTCNNNFISVSNYKIVIER